MDTSLPGGCSAQGVPPQVEALGGTEVGDLIGKQSSLGFLKLHTTGAPTEAPTGTPIVEPTKTVEVQPSDGNFRKSKSLGAANEDSRLIILGSSVVAAFQNSDPGALEIWKKGNGLSVTKSLNGALKVEELKNGGNKSVAKDAPQVRTESQLPMRQLARKGGLLKGEAVSVSKVGPSVADAVKEGILKKERQEQDKKDALAAVMAVHGRMKEAIGHAALFPGATGPDSGRLCQCCNQPESLKSTIFCDKCERGFHVECQKHWPKPARDLDVWHCGPCGLQPGHYWPLGRVLISYDDAVAEYQKYSSSFLTSLQRKEEFGSFPLSLDQRTLEKSNGLEGGATKVKVIRDFKKEARKGTAKGNVLITSSQAKAGHATPMHLNESGTMTGIQTQSKTPNYPGYVPIQPRSLLNSVAPIVNFIVPPESSVVMTLPSPKAHASGNHQSRPTLDYTVSTTPGSAHTGSVTSLNVLYKDSTGPAALSSQSEIALGGSQYQNTSMMNQYVASSITGPSNLSSGPNQISFQPKIPPASGAIGLEVSSIEELRPYVVGERLTEREELLKEAKESLKQLRTFISGLKGNLPEDWRVILRRRPTGAQEKFYLSPAKRKYRSRQDVARFLGLVDDPRVQRTKSTNLETSTDKLLGKNETSSPAIQAIAVRNLPMFFGDVMIEKLGVIDPRPTYSEEHHIWPVGFRSSWHDPETGSYCISAVEDGGDLGPIFRVTRKLVIGPANNNDDLLVPSSLEKSAPVMGVIVGEAGKFKVSDQKSDFPNGALEGAKIGDSIVYKVPAEGSKGDAQRQCTEGGSGDFNKHHDQREGHKESNNPKDGIILVGKGHEGESKTTISDALSKNHVVTNLSVGQRVIDLTEEKELSEQRRSGIPLDFRVPAYDVKSVSNAICAGKDIGALENVKADNHHTGLPPVVIDLSDEDDDKLSALVSRDKERGPGVGDVGPINDGVPDVTHRKIFGFLPPPVKPLPNILMEEFTVEARTSGGAWKLFSKQFVEHCKKSLRSGINCTLPILEATNDYVIYHSGTSNLGDGIANSTFPRQESIDRGETRRALLYEKLEKRLGEDRFGLNMPEVQKMITALHPGKAAGNAKAWVKGVDQIVEATRNATLLAPSIKDNAVSASGPWKRRKRRSKADIAAEESAKKMKPSSLELVAQQPLNLGAAEQRGIENVIFRNGPSVLVPAPAHLPAMGSVQSYAPTTTAVPVPPPVIIIEEPRQPPPTGQPVLKRLPSEFVGDLLQVWEFLCRFSDLFGHDLHCTLEDLEAGLMDVAPARAELEAATEMKDSSKHSGEKENAGVVVGSFELSIIAGRGESRNKTNLDESVDKDPMKGHKESSKSVIAVDIVQEKLEVRDVEQATDLNASGEMQPGVTIFPSPCVEGPEEKQDSTGDLKCQGNESKNLNASQGGRSETKTVVTFSNGVLGKGLTFLAQAHIPILKFLAADLKFRVSKSLNEDDGDEPKKRGRKRLCDIGALPPELGDDLRMNAISWPEVAHRYLVAILDVKKQGEIIEIPPEERKKIVRYFEGDGGVMGGAVEGVVGVESDAQVLAEAERELTLRMPKTVEKDIVIFVPQQWDVALTPINPAPKKIKSGKTGELPEVLPKWVEALEPVRKMPTNLGTKLKNQVQVSLDLNPPDWAKATLDWSLSKGTFKSNAAGTTKRAVLEVLAQYHGEELKAINAPRVRKVKAAPSAEHLMQRCRIVLREVAKADSKQVFSNLVGGAFALRSGKDADTLARPLDFRTIDARLAAGAYGGSTDAFAADMRQVWKNVEEVHKSGSAILELSSSLSQLFEKLYLKQVISLMKGVSETRDREKEKPINKAGTKVTGNATDDKLGKAPWEDDTTCRVCGVDEDYDSILLCDGCDAEYHIYCLVPPLEKVPKGNWFCPSCVAVEEGFPEAPPLGEAELAALQEEMERPVAGSILKLEYEDEKIPSACLGKKPEPEKTVRMLRSRTNQSEVELEDETLHKDFASRTPAVESNVEALLKELEEKEYWQLSLSDKLFLLKFLCDEALKTPQVRAHLEKSVEVALELQQQLRDLVAERLKIVIPMDSTNHAKPADIETLQKSQTISQQGPSLGATASRDGAITVPSSDGSVVQLADSMLEMKTQESIVGLDLDLNVEAGKEPESDPLPPDYKVASGSKPVEANKERLLVNGLGDLKQDGNDSKFSEAREEFTTVNSGNGISGQLSLNEKLEAHHDSKQGADSVEVGTSIQADADPSLQNPLKRKFETATSDLPSSLINYPEDLEKVKKDEAAVKSIPSGVESNDLTTKPSDGQVTAGNVLEDKDTRLTPLQIARDLDVRIAKLGAKLFNLSLRREHMGTDHLGREYWALTGIDGRPCLVIADKTSSLQDQTGKDDKQNDAPDLKTASERTKWIYYKGDKALDELVKWLSPRDQQERVLRISIYHWRRSLSSRHLLDMSEIMTAPSDAGACTSTEPSKVVDESGTVKEILVGEETEECSSIRSFPSVKATRLLLKRYAAPNAPPASCDMSADIQKETQFQNDCVLKRCECLELLWSSRHHCQTCHETYESTAEFQTHLNVCPPGSKPNPENVSKENQAQMPPKSKKTKKLSSFDTPPDLHQTTSKAGSAPRSERARRGLKRGGSQPAVDDDVDMEPVESTELLSEYVESLQTQRTPEIQVPVEHTPSNGLLKALEELIETRSPKVVSQPSERPMESSQEPREESETFATTFSVDDWDARTLPAKFGVGSGKQVVNANESQKPEALISNQLNCSDSVQGNTGGWVDDLNIANEGVRGQDFKANQLDCSSSRHGGQGNSGGWVNDLNISDQQFKDQELYLDQANCSSISHNGQGNSGGWVNDLNNNQSFTDQLLESNRLDGSNTAHGTHGNSGGWANDLNVSNQGLSEDAPASFGYYPPAPSMLSTPQSSHERINQIGFSDRGRSFTPPVQNPLAFDSSLTIPSSPDYPSMEGFPSLESSNSGASQYQQLIPPHNTLAHTPVANTNFLLSLSDSNPKHVPYNQFLSPLDQANPPQQLSFQQMLSSPPHSLSGSSSLYPNFLPSSENVNTTPLSYSNLLHSLDSRNPQPVLYSQYNAPLENINLNTTNNSLASTFPNLNYTNASAVPYVNLGSNFGSSGSRHSNLNSHSNPSPYTNLNPHSNPSAARHARLNLHSNPLANFNTNSNPSVPHHSGLNSNSNPSLFTNSNANNCPAPSFAHFPGSNNLGEPETKKFDVGRFNSNSWFDSQSTGEPLNLERPAIIPTKPTARRTSTWDYLINLPLPSSQANERSVQRHPAVTPGDQSSPPPIEAGSLPFDLMFEKPQREDANISRAPEDNGALALDPMFEGQQMDSQMKNSTRDAVSMRADSVTSDLMLKKQEQVREVLREVLREATGPNEVGSLSIDLMSLPEEHIEIVQADTVGTAEETCIDSVQVELIETAKETDVREDFAEAAPEAAPEVCEDSVQVESTEAAKEPFQASVQVDPHEAGKDSCVEDAQVEAQGEAGVDRVEAKKGEVVASSEQRTGLPPPVPVTIASGGRKPVKRFPVVIASVRPLVGEQKDLLKGLQISLLDMEAALATDVLESSRALPVRRRAWRAFVKAASCIYEVTKAIILLELMVKAEYLKPYWGFWSSLSAAARSSSLSSLALRLFALDGAITYERVKAPDDGKEVVNSSKSVKAKKKKPLELPPPPPAKKKKKK